MLHKSPQIIKIPENHCVICIKLNADTQHNIGDVDLWLAPHKGKRQRPVWCTPAPNQISFGDADKHPPYLKRILPQSLL